MGIQSKLFRDKRVYKAILNEVSRETNSIGAVYKGIQSNLFRDKTVHKGTLSKDSGDKHPVEKVH